MRSPVFLTGMMGSGKSTVGRLLARELDAVFVDLDERIETLFGATVADLFEQGEDVFRRCERQALVSLLAEPAFEQRAVVVSTGGGVVLDPESRDDMLRAGTVVFLDVPPAELAKRLQAESDLPARPLLAQAAASLRRKLGELAAARRHAYLDRSLPIDGSGTPQAVLARLQVALGADEGGRDSQVG